MSELREIQLENGDVVKLGCIPATPGKCRSWPVFGETDDTPIIPRTEWKSRIDAIGNNLDVPFLTYCHNQSNIGMCNCSATSSVAETTRLKQGLPLTKLSAGDLYHRISGGEDRGSTLEDGIHELMTNGIADVNTVPYLDWTRNHSDAPTSRKNYILQEAFLCPSFDALVSASLMGFDLVVGIMWRDNFTPDSEGWLPSSGRGGQGGHALHSYRPVYRGNNFGLATKNSWGESWGLTGKCVLPEWVFDHNISGWWAARVMKDSGGIIPTE